MVAVRSQLAGILAADRLDFELISVEGHKIPIARTLYYYILLPEHRCHMWYPARIPANNQHMDVI